MREFFSSLAENELAVHVLFVSPRVGCLTTFFVTSTVCRVVT